MQTTMESGSSKRYKNFYSALQLAMHSVASKWTYEDFKDCFPIYCEEFPEKSQGLYARLSERVFETTKERTDALLAENNAAEATDILHHIVLKARRVGSNSGRRELWAGTLEPRVAVHARTIPLLDKERNQLQAEIVKNAYENEQLIAQLELTEQKKIELEALTICVLDNLDQIVGGVECLPLKDMEQWAINAEETLGPRN